MIRSVVGATVSVALCVASAVPALAQDYRYSGFDSPRGAAATASFRVPLGPAGRTARASYGISLGFGQTVGAASPDGSTGARFIRLADLRFDGTGLERAEVATFDFANLKQDRRLNMFDEGDSAGWIAIGVVVAGLAACLLAECFSGGDGVDNNVGNNSQ